MKKKLTALILTVAIASSMAACGDQKVDNSAKNATSKEGVFDAVDLADFSEAFQAEDYHISQAKVVGDKIYLIADVYMDNGYQICYASADFEGNVISNHVIYEQIWESYDVPVEEAVPLAVEKAALATATVEVVVEEATTEVAAENGIFQEAVIEDAVTEEAVTEEEDVWHNIYGYQILNDGKLAYIDGFEKYNQETEVYESTLYVVLCDENGEELAKTNISEKVEEGTYIYVNTMIESEADTLYLLCNEIIFELDKTGGIVGQYEATDVTRDLYNVAFYKDGQPVFATWNEDYTKQSYAIIDLRKGEIIEEVTVMDNLTNYTIFDGSNSGYEMILVNNIGVYGYNLGDTEPKLIMDYINSNLATGRVRNICFQDSEHFVAIYNDLVEYKNHIAHFTRVAPENVPDREVLTMVTYGTDTETKKAVIEYNRNSDMYKIIVEDYSKYATNEDWQAGITRLNNEIISGNVPDIIQCSTNLPLENYASKGILADFYELMDNDETINREDYAENVFKAYEIDGKLYELPTQFYAWTVLGKTSIFGEDTSLTWDELAAVQVQYPEAQVFAEMTKSNALSNALMFSYSQLVDEATGECHFNSDMFKNILEYANSFPAEINWDELYSDDNYWLTYQSQYIEDKTLLYQTTIYSIYEAWSGGFRNFTEAVTPVGFPTDNGQGSVLSAMESYAISAKSANIEGAWDFVKSFITREAQMPEEDADVYYIWGLPILKEALEAQAMTITTKPYWIDENGEKVEYNNSVWIGDQEIPMDPASEEEAQKWVDFILSIDKKGGYDYEQAMEIISEDVEGYFSGKKTVDDVAGIIQSRMDIFISESR